MPAKQKTLDDLFLHTLKDIYYAEKKILRNLKTLRQKRNLQAIDCGHSATCREPYRRLTN